MRPAGHASEVPIDVPKLSAQRQSNPTSIALILVATEEARVAQLYADERMVHLGVAMRVRVRVRVRVQARASGGRG